ncbi:hypothetical protein LTR36_006630 [Oleoguttula mirabilis]|uniref:Kinesin-like protein n=1 Tax=Oleoguttula mirabilis TaxID=1507867 RepID=A0AAV9JBK4_9PEZI|nr:hypothetical protein LTR36_006630 [Oleoguttula mirabilis]
MDHHRPSTALFDVYLRLRPSSALDKERFLDVEQTDANTPPTHITIKPPANDQRKRAVERFAFTRVFEEHAGQRELFESTGVLPLVEGVLGAPGREGRDGLVATLGVTGSGKSHTILGSKSQRGITQLTLDVLFQQTAPYLADIDTSHTVYPSLCAADASEANLLPAAHFLDSIYSGDASGALSRATTPALVRSSDWPLPSSLYTLPPAFSPPPLNESVSSNVARPSTALFDRLYYPSLSKYQSPQQQPRSPLSFSPTKSTVKPISKFAHVTRSIAKFAHLPSAQETSFLSAPSSKRYMPRVSTLPQYPPVDDINLAIDTSAEYAIVISMYEVYNDRIFDLLTPSTTSTSTTTSKTGPQKRRALLFKSTEASPDRKLVAGLRKVICSTLDQALLVLETGLQERRIAGTGTNAASSRSHGFFCTEVKKRHRGTSSTSHHHALPAGPWTSSTLTLVDLAGSERARTAKTAGATLAEAGKINESLMYLGQCMQMQADNAHVTTAGSGNLNLVPFRQCKLTELLFSNSLATHHSHQPHAHKSPQKAIMIVTADPLGDFNATSQILRYSALAREVTVPRIPSVTSTILASTAAAKMGNGYFNGRTTPSAFHEELDAALATISALRDELSVAQLLLAEERQRRVEAETSWTATEQRVEAVEAEVREEVWGEFEARLALEQRRWRAGREAEMDAQDEHLDRKLELLTQNLAVWEDETAEGKENASPGGSSERDVEEEEEAGEDLDYPSVSPFDVANNRLSPNKKSAVDAPLAPGTPAAHLQARNSLLTKEMFALEDDNRALRERMAAMERAGEGRREQLRSPSKKMRVLKTPSRKWEGSGVGLDGF